VDIERFPLDTSRIIPKWFLVLWDILILGIAALGTIGLAIQKNPASVAFVAIGAVMIGGLHLQARGFANPQWNYVEVATDRLRVKIYGHRVAEVPCFQVDSVQENAQHRFPQGLFGFWPYYPNRTHIDILLRKPRFLPPTWGGFVSFLRVKVIHLDVIEPEQFVTALSEGLKTSG